MCPHNSRRREHDDPTNDPNDTGDATPSPQRHAPLQLSGQLLLADCIALLGRSGGNAGGDLACLVLDAAADVTVRVLQMNNDGDPDPDPLHGHGLTIIWPMMRGATELDVVSLRDECAPSGMLLYHPLCEVTASQGERWTGSGGQGDLTPAGGTARRPPRDAAARDQLGHRPQRLGRESPSRGRERRAGDVDDDRRGALPDRRRGVARTGTG